MAYNPDFQITPESDKHLYKDRGYPVFFYEKDEMAGKTPIGNNLLSWRDFLVRNPDRTAMDIQTWGDLDTDRVRGNLSEHYSGLCRTPRIGTEKKPVFYYGSWEPQEGLLPWEEFVKRNPERSAYAINQWDYLNGGSD